MANTKQSTKRARQAEKHRHHNVSCRSMIRTYVKKTMEAIENSDASLAKAKFLKLQPILDRYATKGLIHPNKSARYKNRLFSTQT